jgi:hypothetical protein
VELSFVLVEPMRSIASVLPPYRFMSFSQRLPREDWRAITKNDPVRIGQKESLFWREALGDGRMVRSPPDSTSTESGELLIEKDFFVR